MIKKHIPFLILLIILAVYLGLKTLPENGWSGWCDGECDAQTLLSADHWAREGFLKNYLLFIPIGYSKIVRYLDDPAMRQHARGTITGELIGNRLYYTHYPPGYLIPYALLAKLGIDPMTQRPYFRLLVLLFSLSALVLLYVFFNLLTKNSIVSFFAILYYAISTMFLDYADSLANQPIDELLRNAILVLSLLVIKFNKSEIRNSKYETNLNDKNSNDQNLFGKFGHLNFEFVSDFVLRASNLIIWILYFLLSISSYDSTFFVFIWLIGLEIILLRVTGYELGKKILFFASAPILAFALQLLQNYWYLGWPEVWLDAFGAFMAKAQTGNILLHFKTVFYTWSLATGFNILWSIVLLVGLMVIFWFTPLEAARARSAILLLIGAGAVHSFIFVGSGGFSYQGKQIMPALALLVGYAVSFLYSYHSHGIRRLVSLFIILISLWSGQIYRTVQYIYDWPNNKADARIIEIGKKINLNESGDRVVFDLAGKPIGPRGEYYSSSPVLYFKNQEDLIRDFLWLKNNSQFSFDSVFLLPGMQTTDKIKNQLPEQYQNEILFIDN